MKFETIGNVFPIIRNGANIKQDKVTDGYPITRIETIADGTVDLNRVGYASIHDENFSDFYLKENDILMSHINSVSHLGKVALVNGIEKKVIHGMNLLCLKADENKINPVYSFYFFKSPVFRSKIKRITKKSVNQASFNISNLKDIEIPLPPLPDQLHIASILSKAENLIAQRKESIRLLDEFLKSTFLEMFGDPVRNEKGWEEKTLGEMTINENSKRIPIKEADRDSRHGEFPYYGASGIIDWIDDYTHEGNRLLIGEDGANLLFRTTPVAYIAAGKYWVNNHAHVLNNNSFSNLRYIEFYINAIDLKRYITGSAQPKLNRNKLDSIKIFCPPISLQNQFAQIVEKTEALKSQYQQSLQELEHLYGSLSQKAFRGELTTNKTARI